MSSTDYLSGDFLWDNEFRNEDRDKLKIKNPLSEPTEDEQSDSRNPSLETVDWGGSTPTLRNPSVSSDSGNESLRFPNCPIAPMFASFALLLTFAGVIGIIYFGFPSDFNHMFK